MAKKWKGVLAIEGVQTGDGRVIAQGALEWPDPPLPLAWLKASMHGMGGEGGVSVGNIATITRGDGDEIVATGLLDDGHDDGAAVVRQLIEGTAPLGNRWGLSIDPDDWVVEYVDTDPETVGDDGEDTAILASLPSRVTASGRGPVALAAALASFAAMTAAAGDPDSDDGVVVHQEDVGRYIARFTHLRIRGVTMVQTEAIVGAYLELDGDAPAEEPDDEQEPVAAAASRPAPPRAYFEIAEPDSDDDERLVRQPSGGYSVPLTIGEPDEHGWRPVFGHLAHWGQCHIAYADQCRTVPASPSGYAHYRLHAVETDAGDVVTGPLLMGCDHASTDLRNRLTLAQAKDHYANTGLAWADVTIVDGTYGPWISGVVKEEIDAPTLRRIKASGWSGDWRPTDGGLELVAVQSVPTPGFPQLRLVASASGWAAESIAKLDAEIEPWGTQVVYDDAGEVAALIVASAGPEPTTATPCGCGGKSNTMTVNLQPDAVTAGLLTLTDAILSLGEGFKVLERRTRHLVAAEAESLVASLDD